ncbi:MAG: helix-turn-helix domain-containing protein [Aequorivita sp.]|nr:helix-turn-helix domain-containing protein [Aequorivita sp.]
MTIYQLLNDDNNLTVIVKLIKNKIIPSATIVNEISIYEKFYQLKGKKQDRYNSLAEEFRISSSTVRRIISKLNSNAK